MLAFFFAFSYTVTMDQFKVSEKDLASITSQLGRAPEGLFRVKTYAPDGEVQTLETYPLLKGRPHPSLYWLVCSRLKKEIDRLEASGWIKKWEDELSDSDEFKALVREDHKTYQENRMGLLSPEDKQNLNEAFLKTFEGTGIGGIADFDRIRCFHMHFAHYLASGQNTIGSRLEAQFSLLERAYGKKK